MGISLQRIYLRLSKIARDAGLREAARQTAVPKLLAVTDPDAMTIKQAQHRV